jgi:hypothetical protein
MRTILTLAATAAFMQASLALPCDHVKGTGEVVKRALTVEAFHGIIVEGSIDVVFTKAGTQRVEVEAQANIGELVTTEVNNGVWTIGTSKNYSTNKVFTVHISLPVIDQVHILGSGNVSGKDVFTAGKVDLDIEGSGDIDLAFEANELSAAIAGSGDMKLSGSCSTLSVAVAGSGDVNAKGLKAKNASVSTSGSGDVSVTTSGSLDATIAGSGDIVFSGNPAKVNQHVSGSGEVRTPVYSGQL